MHSRLAACVVLIAGCALLAIPAQPAGQSNQDYNPTVAFTSGQTGGTLASVSFPGNASTASCTLQGRPCNPKQSTCCPGSKCVFRGGSTRVGYQCAGGARLADPSSSFWDKLSANKLDPGLTEAGSLRDPAAE